MTAMLSLRGVMPVMTTVASGARLPDFSDNRGDAARHLGGARVRCRRAASALPTLLVPAMQHDDLRIHAVELAVLQAPQHVLRLVGAPAEVRGIPACEIRASSWRAGPGIARRSCPSAA